MWFVRKHAPLLQLDFCAIAKGYGVDAVAGVLAAADIGDFLVEIGGELYGRGVNPQRQPDAHHLVRQPERRRQQNRANRRAQ